MILTKEVLATVSGRSKKHFEDLGYKLPYSKDSRGRIGVKKGSQILVKVEDLLIQSGYYVNYECEDCKIIKEVKYCTLAGRANSQYNKSRETLCNSCANKRMSGTNSGAYKHGSIRYPEYKYNASRRKLTFSLTVEQFENIVQQQCHYCNGHSLDTNPKSRGNGVDRRDSTIGYEIYNCVPCCATCNFIKNSMPYRDFILYIRRLYEGTKNYEV